MFITHCGINTQFSPAFFPPLLPNTSSTFEKAIISQNLISINWDLEANTEQRSDHTGKTLPLETEAQEGLQKAVPSLPTPCELPALSRDQLQGLYQTPPHQKLLQYSLKSPHEQVLNTHKVLQ